MKSPLFKFAVFSLLFTLTLTACKKNPSGASDDQTEGEHYSVNRWIQANMDYYYFWHEFVPEEVDGFETPENYFEDMLEPNDKFSYISDDAESLLDELNGSSFSAGFSPAFGQFSNSDNVFIIVRFTYPDTPADEAGISRGDIILKINGQDLTIDNYLDLYYSGPEITYTMGVYNPDENTISEGETITLTKQQLELDPVLHTAVIDTNNIRVGYLFYAQFLNGENDKFIDRVDQVLAEFNEAGIDELILDLRYNPGGRISAATNFGNSLAPPSVVADKEIFVQYQYNETLQQDIIEEEGEDSPNLVVRFNEDPVNLNLDQVYMLTTSRSASASELLINGLDPHMDVITVGSSTFGKFYGSFVLTGRNASTPNNYAIVPVVLKYANALGVTDFRDGLLPDYEATEDILQPNAIGDYSDPLLGKALQLITGGDEPPAKAISPLQFELLPDVPALQQGNILWDKTDFIEKN